MHHKFLLVALSLIVLATSLGAPAAMAQNFGYSTVGNGPTIAVYNPGNPVNGYAVPGIVTPNYIGSGHNAAYGTYNSPATGYQVNVNTGQPLTYRPNAQTYGGRSYGYGGGGGISTMGMLVGGGALGIGALAVGSRMMANRRGGGSGSGGPNTHYEKDMQKADERRHKQEEKIQRELAQAHEAELKRKGIMPTSAQGPAPAPRDFNQGRPPNRAKNSEDLEGDVVPTSATQKLDF